jgi:hypothetical protein
MIERAVMATVPAAGALLSSNSTASVIMAASVAAVLLSSPIGRALNHFPEWAERVEQAREVISKGRHRRKKRRATKRP